MKKHLVIGLFLLSSFGLLFWQLKVSVKEKSLTQVSYAATTVCTTTNIKGDANCDARIDYLDYSLWRQTYLGISTDSSIDADFNDDDKVDMKDFEIWRRGVSSVTPTITTSPTCVPLPACVNDPVNPCAVRPPYEGYYCPPTTPTATTIPTINPTATPIQIATPIVEDIPACSECGTAFGEKPGGLCGSEIVCLGTQSCTEVKTTCTINGVSNPNCYKAQCSSTNDL